VWWLARQNFEQDRAQTVDVGPLVHVLDTPCRLFRRHVAWRAHFLACLRGICAAVFRDDDRGGVFVVTAHLASQSPVQHNGFTVFAQHDVVGLQVAVNNAPGVCVGDRIADIQKNTEQAAFSQRVFVPGLLRLVVLTDGLRERFAPHQFHRVERPALMADLIHRHNPRMLELPGNLSFLDQSSDGLTGCRTRLDFLEGNFSREIVIPSQPDLPQSTRADFTDPCVSRLRLLRLVQRLTDRFNQDRSVRRP
jgi:hypothetical protein